MEKSRRASRERANWFLKCIGMVFAVYAILALGLLFWPNTSYENDITQQTLTRTIKNIQDIPRPLRVPFDAISGNTELPRNQYLTQVIHLFKTRRTLGYDPPEDLLEFDPDKDGQLTEQELEELANQAFSLMDSNHDSYLSRNEITSVQNTLLIYRHCKPRPVPPHTKLIHIGAGRGAAISTVSIVGHAKMTTTITIDIPLHVGPLYLVLTGGSSIIWKFMGNTPAVHHVVITQSENGVSGISKDKIEFMEQTCFYNNRSFHAEKWFDGNFAIMELVGKPPDLMGWKSQAGTIFIGFKELVFQTAKDTNLGGWATIPKGFHPKVLSRYSGMYPDGITVIDPTQVISSKEDAVEQYDEVLSDPVKLAMLAQDRVIKFGPRFSNVITILKDSDEIPWYSLKNRTVILPEGMSIPNGLPKEICVLREKTGEVLADHNCFSDGIIRERRY